MKRFLLTMLCITLVFCAAGMIAYFTAKRDARIIYAADTPASLSVFPGADGRTDFEFAVLLPQRKKRQYVLKMYDAAFAGEGLGLSDMNDGEWEYRLDGGEWTPLIWSNGECTLESDIFAGERSLSIRATNRLGIEAAGGELMFKLKLTRA